jgi:hypothetical protein
LSYYKLGQTTATSISTPTMTTQASGSTIVVSIGRGDINKFVLPTDSKGNAPYQQLGAIETYPSFKMSGTGLYAFPSAVGGANFTVNTTTGTTSTGQGDEITIAAVEVVGASRIAQFAWNEVKTASNKNTSASVTTTGAATLIAFWWGDGFPGNMSQDATPDSGFTRIDTNAFEMFSFVQCAVAVKNVTAAGTYNLTWTVVPDQGAQLWLVAVD